MSIGKKQIGAQLRERALITTEESQRVRELVKRLGSRPKTAKRLGVGISTIEAACEGGDAVLPPTKAKLLAALENVERELAEAL